MTTLAEVDNGERGAPDVLAPEPRRPFAHLPRPPRAPHGT
jgi:hypothetical protein